MSALELAGSFFLLPKPAGWQGQFLSDADGDVVLVQLYSWLTGEPTSQRLISIDQVKGAAIFECPDKWREAAAKFFDTGVLP